MVPMLFVHRVTGQVMTLVTMSQKLSEIQV